MESKDIPGNPGVIELEIQEIREEVPGFRTFIFEGGHGIHYAAGQFLTFLYDTGKETIRRSYSITSSPAMNEPLSIGVKRIDNGIFSRFLFDYVKKGDKLLTTGPGGFFQLPADAGGYPHIFFFAAGSGITPIMSLVKSAIKEHEGPRLHLVYSNHSPATAAYLTVLKQLEENFPERFHIDFLFGNNPDLLRARLNRDLFLEIILGPDIDIHRSLFYTCGPESYMRMIIFLLEELGVPGNHIRKEDFFRNKVIARKPMPPAGGPYEAIIHSGGKEFRFVVNYPDTILQAAKQASFNLPYSCETGKCGYCAAKILKGNVWMSANEVLTDDELEKGLTLTCVGHPVQGSVELMI